MAPTRSATKIPSTPNSRIPRKSRAPIYHTPKTPSTTNPRIPRTYRAPISTATNPPSPTNSRVPRNSRTPPHHPLTPSPNPNCDKKGGSQRPFVKIIIAPKENIPYTESAKLSVQLEYHFLNHYNRLYRNR